MILAVIYVMHQGLEVLFRLAQIFLMIMLFLGIIGNLFVCFSGKMDVKNLLPIQGEGWGTIFHAAYPYIFAFPFSEILCFTTVFPHLNNSKLARKTGLIALTVSACGLSLTHAVEMTILGKDIYSRTTFPLFTTISLVKITDLFQRPDVIVILTIIIGVFFKMSMYYYAAVATNCQAAVHQRSDGKKTTHGDVSEGRCQKPDPAR